MTTDGVEQQYYPHSNSTHFPVCIVHTVYALNASVEFWGGGEEILANPMLIFFYNRANRALP